jgi:hypothetical protein
MRVIAVVEMIWIHSFETPDVIAESSSRRSNEVRMKPRFTP